MKNRKPYDVILSKDRGDQWIPRVYNESIGHMVEINGSRSYQAKYQAKAVAKEAAIIKSNWEK